MARTRFVFLIIPIFCAMGSPAFAQSGQAVPQEFQPGVEPYKAQSKKSPRAKSDAAASAVRSDPKSKQAEEAARLAEARKKFFEQSTGFDEKNSDNSLSLGGSNGLSPQMGFKF
jgi:hypothetical protein